MSSNKKNKKKIGLIFVSIIIILIIGITVYGYNLLNKVDNIDISKDDEDLGIDKDLTDRNSKYDVKNVVLFGIDKRGEPRGARSDSIMIASLDNDNKVIKLTSLMRDTYIDIPGVGMDKLGHAYAFGGPQLAIRTINHNFNMDIKEFMAVDFDGFEQIIDTMGGVEIELTPAEAEHMNMPNSGKQLLDGEKALEYSRIRKIGNADYERTERQRTVLEEVFKKMTSMSATSYPNLLNTLLPLVETSLTKPEMINFGTDIIGADIKNIEQFRLPVDEHMEGQMIDGVSYVVPITIEDNAMQLRDFIYGEDNMTLSD